MTRTWLRFTRSFRRGVVRQAVGANFLRDVLGLACGAVLARGNNIMRMRCLSSFSRVVALALGVVVAAAPGRSAVAAAAEKPYLDNKPLVARVKELAREHKGFVHATEICESAGKNEVWRLELGTGSAEQRAKRPAMLVVAGIEGNDLAGTAAALAWVESLARQQATNEVVRKLLDSTTVHVWPRLNPDAAQRFFAKPLIETSMNGRADDQDRDGLSDEDGPEDLNGDGVVTAMRVEDPDGEWMLDPVDARLLVKADRVKGERGAWKVFSEGRDNDGDEQWNEDGVGGVNFNRNFPYGYRFFADGAGRHQVSETETRALADFIVAHPEIGVVFSFGAADNLSQTPKGDAPKRPPVALHEGDVGWYREMGKAWREQFGVKKELTGASEPGTFGDWMYFHRGRLSLSARAWFPQLQLEMAKASAKEGDEGKKDAESKKDGEGKSDKPAADKKTAEKDSRNEEERAFLKWIEQNGPEAFVAWKAFEHPDFPGKHVEVGGFAPYAKMVPPAGVLSNVVAQHGSFLTDLAGRLPRMAIRKVETKALGESVFDITVTVENAGRLPTSLAQGNTSREVHPTRVRLKVDRGSLLSGDPTETLGALQPGESREIRWVVRAKGMKKIGVEVISVIAGRAETEVELKEGK